MRRQGTRSEVGSRRSELRKQCADFRPPTSDLRLRSGLSLLEVLIAIFILGVGLMGIGALLPVGQTQIAEGTVMDHAAALAQYAVRQFKIGAPVNCKFDVSGALDGGRIGSMGRFENWFGFVTTGTAHWDDWPTLVSTDPASLQPTITTASSLPALTTATAPTAPVCVCIDPLLIARNTNASTTFSADNSAAIARFPFSTPTGSGFTSPSMWMKRITLFNTPNSGTSPALVRAGALGLAEQFFMGHDELSFDSTTFKDRKPLWPNSFFRSGVSGQTLGPQVGVIQKRPFDANYSWLATLVPATGLDGVVLQNQFLLSVVVFYERNCLYYFTNERQVNVPLVGSAALNPLNSGNGGVRVQFVDDLTHSIAGQAGNTAVFAKPGDWIMLGGLAPYIDANNNTANRQIFRWYRIVGVGQIGTGSGATAKNVTTLTLQGPDWNPVISSTTAAAFPLVGSTPATVATATFVNGVVAVFERTIRIDNASLYTQ